MGDRAALCTAEGVLYRDGSGRRWLDPTKPETLRYITDLAEECARLGFDEILLDWFLYPTSGDQTALDLPAEPHGPRDLRLRLGHGALPHLPLAGL